LVRRPDRFVTTVTEKLLTFALGRGVESYDQPAIRRIVKDAEANGYRLSTIVAGVAKSYPFLNRRVDGAAALEASASRP
jgi:hypothetical protein